MKHLTRITAAVLSVLLLGSLAAPAFAAAAPFEKEEVIYIMTDASGKVTDLEAVNIFAGGDITDYGDYSAVKILNTTDAITQDGDEIDSMTASITGGDAEIVSFVSDKNIHVGSVQFVIKTAAIEKAEAAESAAAEEAPLTFWQKLLHLFGLD